LNAILAIEDGTIYNGKGIGNERLVTGEIVFTTSMTGYEESLTDPSFKGQILLFTYPLIGNYGINKDRFQSDHIHAEGVVVREFCDTPSHYMSESSIEELIKSEDTLGISGIDTRDITIKIRNKGAMRAGLAIGDYNEDEVLNAAKSAPFISDLDLIGQVSCNTKYRIQRRGKKIAVLDLGIKKSIVKSLADHGFDLYIYPYNTTGKEIEECEPDAIFFSNGPGDPKKAKNAIYIAKYFLGVKPLIGVCLGHQIVCLGAGGDTYKLKFGHRGENHPVKNIKTDKVFITSQNHGFAVDAGSFDKDSKIEVSEINVNDKTVEGVRSDYFNILTVQYHPEAFPGPRDSEKRFFDDLKKIIDREELE